MNRIWLLAAGALVSGCAAEPAVPETVSGANTPYSVVRQFDRPGLTPLPVPMMRDVTLREALVQRYAGRLSRGALEATVMNLRRKPVSREGGTASAPAGGGESLVAKDTRNYISRDGVLDAMVVRRMRGEQVLEEHALIYDRIEPWIHCENVTAVRGVPAVVLWLTRPPGKRDMIWLFDAKRKRFEIVYDSGSSPVRRGPAPADPACRYLASSKELKVALPAGGSLSVPASGEPRWEWSPRRNHLLVLTSGTVIVVRIERGSYETVVSDFKAYVGDKPVRWTSDGSAFVIPGAFAVDLEKRQLLWLRFNDEVDLPREIAPETDRSKR